MLFLRLYKIHFLLSCFPIQDNLYPKYCKSYKKCQSMKSETLSLKAIIKEYQFLRKKIIIQ